MDNFEVLLKKQFNIVVDVKDVLFTNSDVKPYSYFKEDGSLFGEKSTVLYTMDIQIFHAKFHLRILSFTYPTHNKILKLDIDILDKLLEPELAYCRNFLQRKRNLNLTLETLIKFSEVFESRRLICQTIFSKHAYMQLQFDPDEGMIVKYVDKKRNFLYIECHWKILWNLENYKVIDSIEFIYNETDQDFVTATKPKMMELTHPSLNFRDKLKLWQDLIKTIDSFKKIHLVNQSLTNLEVLVISDDELEIIENLSDGDSVIVGADSVNIDDDISHVPSTSNDFIDLVDQVDTTDVVEIVID